ncbi:hypothetical protein HHK36_031388 (mitochondrion) [Tetracentron sinense]|uniref:Uncharacterized protein n=1 Tax=Tetracentron sinense TaxID=13715 RepID=A0A834Y6W9_TETSI|nr:hypothetical protein LWB77_mgp24 [Tetracentron sinense]KAF8364949.1 hypothetical protein HHK36_033028 [Tetracentron sinense]KAF8376883.1 hypothetical protein HHK36_031388 [Tetracentron sinense]
MNSSCIPGRGLSCSTDIVNEGGIRNHTTSRNSGTRPGLDNGRKTLLLIEEPYVPHEATPRFVHACEPPRRPVRVEVPPIRQKISTSKRLEVIVRAAMTDESPRANNAGTRGEFEVVAFGDLMGLSASKRLSESELFIAANSASLACKAARQRHASIGNERRSGGTCGTTYWITPVRHEAADAESAPMPLAMPCLVPRHGGGSVARHEHRAKGGAVEQLKRTALPYYNIGTEGRRL